MSLKDLFFGKKKEIHDSLIGILKTRIKNENLNINYVWYGENHIKSQKRQTVFILEGNSLGPFSSQLSQVHKIINEIDEIYKKTEIGISGSLIGKNELITNFRNNFYLASITPWKVDEGSFEINFEPIMDDESGYISFIWKNSEISDLNYK